MKLSVNQEPQAISGRLPHGRKNVGPFHFSNVCLFWQIIVPDDVTVLLTSKCSSPIGPEFLGWLTFQLVRYKGSNVLRVGWCYANAGVKEGHSGLF